MSSYGTTFSVQLGVEVGLVDGAGGHRVKAHLGAVGNILQSWGE